MISITNEMLTRIANCRGTAWATWEPRPDTPAEYDQQTAFIKAKDLVSFALGGNSSGKTSAGCRKLVEFVLTTPPPRRDTPFWIVGESYQQVCGTCWAEKLDGVGFMPEWEVDRDRIVWLKPTINWPLMVPLKPWPNGNNWCLEFKSYEQGREAMHARSLGGFWLSEQFPWVIFLEILRGCRDAMHRGGQFCEFTPIAPDLCVAIEKIMDNPPPGWGFYRLNTALNKANLAPEWFDSFFGAVPTEMKATRMTGALAQFQGAIYPSFNVHTHTEPLARLRIPNGCQHWRGFDWGFSEQHPFSATWGYMDGTGDIKIYAEYFCPETKTIRHHAMQVLAISLAFGWPVPDEILLPSRENGTFAAEVLELADKMNPGRIGRQTDEKGLPKFRPGEYGQSYGDSSRPDCIAQFNQVGIGTTGGTHEVLKGIEEVQSVLEIDPSTGKPHLIISDGCPHHIEAYRKYRWKTREDDGVKPHEPFKLGPFKKGDDPCDSSRYGIFGVRKSRGLTLGTTQARRDQPEIMAGQFHRLNGKSAAQRMMPSMRRRT